MPVARRGIRYPAQDRDGHSRDRRADLLDGQQEHSVRDIVHAEGLRAPHPADEDVVEVTRQVVE